MLPKEFRLHQDKEIKALAKTGQSFFLPQMVVKHAKNKEGVSKFGFIVSTKVDKRAVVRNKLQRQMREIIRDMIPSLKTGRSVLIIAKKQALELDFEGLKKQISFAFDKIGLYNK